MKKTYYEVLIEITFGDYSFEELRRIGTTKNHFDKEDFKEQLENYLYPEAYSIEVKDFRKADSQEEMKKHPRN